MDSNKIQETITEMERELHDLKTIQGGIKYMTAYTMNYTNGATGLTNQLLEVEYGDGEEPIFSELLGSNVAVALEITNNKQKFFLRLFYANQTISISSNRPILSITNVS